MFDQNNRFIIEDYSKKPPFSSFLPGISGARGIPLWCYYVNRGQGVCGFGSEDKGHAIMEFYPAHRAYQVAERNGFRTFVRINGDYSEPFSGTDGKRTMAIGLNELSLTDENSRAGIKTEARYCILPEERLGGLIRRLTITNISDREADIELLDGMAEVVPYGVDVGAMKTMTQTAKAWMRTEYLESRMPFFGVSVSMEDSPEVSRVQGGNFASAVDDRGERLAPLVDPELVFDFDTAYANAEGFKSKTLCELLETKQTVSNRLPCCFFALKRSLAPGESLRVYQLIGLAESRERLERYSEKLLSPDWFEKKLDRAVGLTGELCSVIDTKTADPVFDAYCRSTYLDNVLRGGVPVFFGSGDDKKVFYLYSRKHGDPERDYNEFRMSPEYYSQGNGNYRDVSQNRRSDVLFAPAVGKENIKQFFSLHQIDGGNPLSVDKMTFWTEPEKALELKDLVSEECGDALYSLLTGGFTPGGLAMAAEDWTLAPGVDADALLNRIISASDSQVNASFGEGYWSDHWTYDLDLIESYLAIYPEKEKELLTEQCYPWFESQAYVLPREKRYVEAKNGVRQYGVPQRVKTDEQWLRTTTGERALSSLLEKLVIICGVKFASLDPDGMGIEMEGGKPGWYDALNGLPGVFGSSMNESCELLRTIDFVLDYIERKADEIGVFDEAAELLRAVSAVAGEFAASGSGMGLWNGINSAKEAYREQVKSGVTGERTVFSAAELSEMLGNMRRVVSDGIEKARGLCGGICPTYFTHEVTRSVKTEDGIKAEEFSTTTLPLFLEGVVRWMKLEAPAEEKRKVAGLVRESGLFDQKLGMYKVNESISSVTYEAGRACAFTPGWLENESIWLHMEYKYLLELLKSGMYDLFAADFKDMAVPFMDPDVYGRSTLENSSFIASSANPDPAVHGRGFVARLSGSTAEFLQMWQIMMFGKKPFTTVDGELALALEPFIPDYLMPEDGVVSCRFLGCVDVVYRSGGALVPGGCKPCRWELEYADSHTVVREAEKLVGDAARDVRDGLVKKMTVIF